MKNSKNELLLKTIYGDYVVQEPLVTLINSPSVQRLKKIAQRGAAEYAKPYRQFFSRYGHSVGVLVLAIFYKAGIKTQIAALLHDVSHTVFSHVVEFVFDHKSEKDSYQDQIHEWFLKKQKVDLLLQQLGFSLDDILHKSDKHKMLERDLPEICLDRLEYNLRAGLFENLINQNDIDSILNNLKFENENFFFTDIKIAKKFAYIPLKMTEKDWGAAWGGLTYIWLAEALKRAIELKIITFDDIHFSTDDIVLDKLKKSGDEQILEKLNKIFNYKDYFEIGSPQNFDKKFVGKFRGIDPWVAIGDKLERLTNIDVEFKTEFDRVKKLIAEGWYIKLK